jgi:hypothetical protein
MESEKQSPMKETLESFLERYRREGVLGSLVFDLGNNLIEQKFDNMNFKGSEIKEQAGLIRDIYQNLSLTKIGGPAQKPEHDMTLNFDAIFICILRLKTGFFVIAAEKAAGARINSVMAFGNMFKRRLDELMHESGASSAHT